MEIRTPTALKKIAWGITGGGYLLRESLNCIEELIQLNFKIDIYLSLAAQTVLKMYNFEKKLTGFKEHYKNNVSIITEESQPKGFPVCARFNYSYYQFLVVSPLTANSSAKIRYGIADTLITSIVAQMLKGQGKVLLLPTDLKQGKLTTEVPGNRYITITIPEHYSKIARELKEIDKNIEIFFHPNEILERIKQAS